MGDKHHSMGFKMQVALGKPFHWKLELVLLGESSVMDLCLG